MSIYRRHKKSNYTCIDNHIFMDHSLSLKAKGLLTQIYSLPDDWEYSVKGLASLFSDGRDAVNNALQELIEHGYIIRSQKINKHGKFDGYEYDIYETPQIKDADNPITENPLTDNPFTENQTQLNTKEVNTKKVITKVITKENEKEENSFLSVEEVMFEEFWKAYPQCFRKVNKKGCKSKFLKIKNLKEIFPDIIDSLEMQKNSKQWREQEGQFIPAPLTWINQERWTMKDPRNEIQTKIDAAVEETYKQFLF